MGLFGAMTASVSGLSAQGEAISVISDNLANTNTIGYKATRALFSQLVTTSGSGGTAFNAGGVSSITQRDQNTQGSLNNTSSVTDLSIAGNGFFRVASDDVPDGDTEYFYTRAGSFSENKSGFLVNPAGYYLQGWRTNSQGVIDNLQDLVNVELQSVGVSAQATTEVEMGINLNASTPAISALYDTTAALTATGGTLDDILASTSSDIFITDIRLFDAQGGARDVSLAFSKRAANLWDWQLYTDGSNLQGGTAGTETRITNGTVRFNTNGTLKYVTGATDIDITWADGVQSSQVDLLMGDYTGGKVVTTQTSTGFTDHVMDIAVEDETFAAGTYTIRKSSASTISLYDAAGTGLIETASIGASGVREIYFSTSGVRLTVSNNFDETAGAYPSTVGTFVVTDVAQFDEGRGNDGIIQYSSTSNTTFVNQDGFGSGLLSAIQVDENGFVAGTFTNGETKKLYKLALGVFQNSKGLEAVSGSMLRVTDISGPALIKQPGEGGTGRLVSGSLEGSTTDIANEFSQMIVAQRAFQASSTVITTVDQMLNELLQLR